MALKTRLTERLGIEHPIISAPMAMAGGGKLAAAVSGAGGLGLIGGGYGDTDWIDGQYREAGNARIGCGFITWSLAKNPAALDAVLDRGPAAIMLSFDDPAPFADKIKEAGATLICQVQSLARAREAIASGADIIVAQGGEAGGHAASRATLPLVPEVVDLCASAAPDTLVLAAGGIADGRGLAAALMLGADGVLMGSRFWATPEALVASGLQAAAVAATGDATLQTSTVDIIRRKDWPEEFRIRVLHNRFIDRWQGNESALRDAVDEEEAAYQAALASGDADKVGVIVGESVGLIREIRPAADLVGDIVAEAERRLGGAAGFLRQS